MIIITLMISLHCQEGQMALKEWMHENRFLSRSFCSGHCHPCHEIRWLFDKTDSFVRSALFHHPRPWRRGAHLHWVDTSDGWGLSLVWEPRHLFPRYHPFLGEKKEYLCFAIFSRFLTFVIMQYFCFKISDDVITWQLKLPGFWLSTSWNLAFSLTFLKIFSCRTTDVVARGHPGRHRGRAQHLSWLCAAWRGGQGRWEPIFSVGGFWEPFLFWFFWAEVRGGENLFETLKLKTVKRRRRLIFWSFFYFQRGSCALGIFFHLNCMVEKLTFYLSSRPVEVW